MQPTFFREPYWSFKKVYGQIIEDFCWQLEYTQHNLGDPLATFEVCVTKFKGSTPKIEP